jgi:hypothetical protein
MLILGMIFVVFFTHDFVLTKVCFCSFAAYPVRGRTMQRLGQPSDQEVRQPDSLSAKPASLGPVSGYGESAEPSPHYGTDRCEQGSILLRIVLAFRMAGPDREPRIK